MLSTWYYAYSLTLLLPLYALVRTRPWRRQWDASWWRGIGIASVVTCVMVIPFLIPYVTLRMHGNLTRSLREFDCWSLNAYAFFQPNRLNPMFAGFMERHFLRDTIEWVERGVALGFAAIVLSIVALTHRHWRRALAPLRVRLANLVTSLLSESRNRRSRASAALLSYKTGVATTKW